MSILSDDEVLDFEEKFARSRPNAHLSNWPVPETATDGSFVNPVSIFWPYSVAIILFVGTIIRASLLVYRLWKYKREFPVSLKPFHLSVLCCICAPAAVFAYSGHIIAPSMPCWLHIITTYLVYFPYGGLGAATVVRLYIAYNAQADLAHGKKDTWFIRQKPRLKGYSIDIAIVVFCGILHISVPLSRAFGAFEYRHLLLPVSDPLCSSLSTLQFGIRTVNAFVVIKLQRGLSAIVQEVREPYPFRELHQRVTMIHAVFLFVEQLPQYLKEFWIGIDPTFYQNLVWSCSMLWGMVMAHSYMFFVLWRLTKDAEVAQHRRQKRLAKASNTLKTSSTRAVLIKTSTNVREGLTTLHRSLSSKALTFSTKTFGATAKTTSAMVNLVMVSTSTELKQVLTDNSQLKEAFQEYLATEFCVESMLCLDAVQKYRETVVLAVGDPSKVQEVGQAAREIYEHFIRDGGPLEISNISNRFLRRELLTNINSMSASLSQSYNAVLPKAAAGLFDALESDIYIGLMDLYDRFLNNSYAARTPTSPQSVRSVESKSIQGNSTSGPKRSSPKETRLALAKAAPAGGGFLHILLYLLSPDAVFRLLSPSDEVMSGGTASRKKLAASRSVLPAADPE